MGLSCLPLSLYTRESQMGKTTPQIMTTATSHRKERHQRHHHGEASFSSQGEPEPPPFVGSMSPSPLSSFARLTWAVPCNLELISRLWSRSPSPRLHSRMTWWWANGSGKILDTFKQLCASWALEKTLVNLKEAFIEQMGSARFASSFTWDMKSASYLGHGDQFWSIMRTIWDEESPTKLRWI